MDKREGGKIRERHSICGHLSLPELVVWAQPQGAFLEGSEPASRLD